MEGNKTTCANIITNNQTIQHCIYNKLGINTHLSATPLSNTVMVIDTLKTNVNSKLLSNKLLRHMFTSGELTGYAWLEQESNNIYINLHLTYKNKYGSNGMQLGKLIFFQNKNKCKFIPSI